MQDRSRTREEILAVLRPDAVLAHFGIAARESGDEFRLRICPSCGPRSRDCVCVHRTTGHWFDHAHSCKGDLFSLVGGLANIDCTTDFPAVLALAAQIAGVEQDAYRPPGPRGDDAFTACAHELGGVAPYAATADCAPPPLVGSSHDDVARRASAVWSRLAETSPMGVEYLERRGLAALSTRVDLVRHAPLTVEPVTPWGRRSARLLGRPAICIPVHAVDAHTIVNVVARRLAVRSADDPKVVSLPGIKKVVNGRLAGAFGSWSTFHLQPRDVVVVEGVFDYLTASHLWPEKLVLGADGAALLPKIAHLIAPAVRDAGVRVVLVPHNDEAGYTHGRRTCAELVRAEVPFERVRILDVGRHKDLNDALRAGEIRGVE